MTVPPNLAISGKTRSWIGAAGHHKEPRATRLDRAGDFLDPFVVDPIIGEMASQGAARRPDRHAEMGTKKSKPKRKPQIAPPAAPARFRLVP